MPGIYIRNLPQELVDYIKGLKGPRTWSQWLREIQSDFRKKQKEIEHLQEQLDFANKENEALANRVETLQKMVKDV